MITQHRVAITEKIKIYARELGFDLIRIAKSQSSLRAKNHLKKWLKQGFNADMGWMKNRANLAANPRKILPNAASIICLAANYYTPVPPRLHRNGAKIALIYMKLLISGC